MKINSAETRKLRNSRKGIGNDRKLKTMVGIGTEPGSFTVNFKY